MTEATTFIRPKHPLIIIISGPSGVGKDTIARGLIERNPEQFYFVVTATTRPPREGETNGIDYFFVSNDEFARMIESDELLEYAIVYNDYKGVPKQQIRDALGSGRDVIMRVDVQGAATLRKVLPDAIYIFLSAESEEALDQRLRARRSESNVELAIRIATARKEMRRVDEFDYFVINYDNEQEAAVDSLVAIMSAEKSRVDRTAISL